jgi:hypothetical protein
VTSVVLSRISDDVRRGLAAFVVMVLALGGTSCGSGKAKEQISAYHVKKGMSKNDVFSVGGLPDRTTRHCWIYFVRKPKPHPSRIRICFKHGRVSFIRTVVYRYPTRATLQRDVVSSSRALSKSVSGRNGFCKNAAPSGNRRCSTSCKE